MTPIISGQDWPSVVLLNPRSLNGLQTLFRQQKTQINLLSDCPNGRNARSHMLGNKMPEDNAMYKCTCYTYIFIGCLIKGLF